MAGITGSVPDADAVARRDLTLPGRLPRPARHPHTVDEQFHDGQILPLGDASGRSSAPGHTLGHLCLWQPDERLLIAGDALSDDDVGWVNTVLDGPDAAATTLECREPCSMENRAEPEHLRAGSTPWQPAAQTQIVGDPAG